MNRIEIKNQWTNEVIFTYEGKNATIKEAVEKAIDEGVSLKNADLRYADLSYSDLVGVDLSHADLSHARLYRTDLGYANLKRTNLTGVYLIKADLKSANLNDADLTDTKVPIYSKWYISTVNGKIKIGCKLKSINEWDKWFAGSGEYDTPRNSEDFRRIEAHYKTYKAYLEHMENG